MYTLCPKCNNVQQISRKQLKKKRGQLSCSNCKQPFNAHLTLSKKAPQVKAAEILVQKKPIVEARVAEEQIPEFSALIKAQAQTITEAETVNEPGTIIEPVIETYDWQKTKTRYRPERWFAGIIFGLFLLAYQVYYFNGYSLSQNPHIRPWLNTLSSSINYPIPDYRKPQEFSTLGSSLEPVEQGHYRLQVSLINHANFRQPPPYLQLTLQNFYGGVIAHRLFSPQEYLGKTSAAVIPIQRSATLDIDFLIAKPEQEIGGYNIGLK